MPRDIYNDTVIATASGGAPTVLMSGVLVTVYKAGTTTTVPIYVDRSSPTQEPNPFEAVNGIVRFWADQGEYDVFYHDPLLRIADQTVGWNSIPGGAAGISQAMMAPGVTPPVGAMFPYPGAAEPTGYKFANGQSLSKTTYAALYALLGNGAVYGQDATTFVLPDLRSRVPLGAGTGAGLSARTLGSYGGGTLDTFTPKRGEEAHTLANAEMPSHSHGGATASAGPTTGYMNQNNPHNHSTGADDRDHSHGIGDPGHYHGFYGRGDVARGTGASFAYVGWGSGSSTVSVSGTGIWALGACQRGTCTPSAVRTSTTYTQCRILPSTLTVAASRTTTCRRTWC